MVGPSWCSYAAVRGPASRTSPCRSRRRRGGVGPSAGSRRRSCTRIPSNGKVMRRTWDFGPREAFTAWCAVGFGGWTGHLTAEEGSAFVDQVVDAYAEATGSDHVFRFMQLVGKLSRP